MRSLVALALALLALAPACETSSSTDDPLEGIASNDCGEVARCLVEDCQPLFDELTAEDESLCTRPDAPGCTAPAREARECEAACLLQPMEVCAVGDNACIDGVQTQNAAAGHVFDSCRDGACDVAFCGNH